MRTQYPQKDVTYVLGEADLCSNATCDCDIDDLDTGTPLLLFYFPLTSSFSSLHNLNSLSFFLYSSFFFLSLSLSLLSFLSSLLSFFYLLSLLFLTLSPHSLTLTLAPQDVRHHSKETADCKEESSSTITSPSTTKHKYTDS
jgi:hypothetical protein